MPVKRSFKSTNFSTLKVCILKSTTFIHDKFFLDEFTSYNSIGGSPYILFMEPVKHKYQKHIYAESMRRIYTVNYLQLVIPFCICLITQLYAILLYSPCIFSQLYHLQIWMPLQLNIQIHCNIAKFFTWFATL